MWYIWWVGGFIRSLPRDSATANPPSSLKFTHRYLQFEGKGGGSTKLAAIKRIAHDDAQLMNLSWSADRKNAIAVLIYMMERMGGAFWRYYKWQDELDKPKGTGAKDNDFLTEKEIVDGTKNI